MKNFWIITVANPFCDLLLRGVKTMELRKRVPGIQEQDIIFVCRKGGGTKIVGAFRLVSIRKRTVDYFSYAGVVVKHRVTPVEVKRYAEGHSYLFGLCLSRISLVESIKVEDFGYTRNPQYFYRIRTDFWHNIPEVIMRGEGGVK